MAETAYTILQKSISDLTAQLLKAEADLKALQSDSVMTAQRAALMADTDDRDGSLQKLWRDGSGKLHTGQAATASYQNAIIQVKAWEQKVAAQDLLVKDIKARLLTARAELTKYDMDSGIGKSQGQIIKDEADTLNTLKIKAAENKQFIIVGIVIVLLLTGTIIAIVKLKKPKNK